MTVGGIMAIESHIPINVAPGPYIFLSAELWVLSLGIATGESGKEWSTLNAPVAISNRNGIIPPTFCK
jgi:hypothetical protein